jgi:uncharacterized HAD superfamily protein
MIGIDFDGVICDVHHIFRGHYFDRFGVILDREEEQSTFEFKSMITHPDYSPVWWDEIPVAISKYQHIAPPYKGAIEALDAIRVQFDLPFIQIITAREPSIAVMTVTHLWCANNFPFPYQIDFCATSEEKADVMAMHDIEYFIDDRLKTANTLAPGLKVSYLLERNWNKRRKVAKNVKRVKTIWAMKNHIQSRQ